MRRLVSSKSVSQAAILLLLSSSCALANDGARRSGRDGLLSGGAEPWKDITAGSGMRMAGILQVGHGDDATVEEKIMLSSHSVDNDLLELRWRSPTQNEVAQITPPPSNPLAIRQDQSQIDQLNSRIQSLQQSAQDALQQLSQSSRQVSQASQQLSQSSQQLSQQSQQLSQSSQQLSQSLQQATQSINALQQSVSSALSSGSSAFASCTNSASSVIAAASNDAANQITAAQAQATLARTEADRQVQEAQGTAVSITQAAAIIVGASIGSSILTILIVLVILRYRRKKKERRDREREFDRDRSMSGGGYYEKQRPQSYNSMVDRMAARGADSKENVSFPLPDNNVNDVGGGGQRGPTTTSMSRRGDNISSGEDAVKIPIRKSEREIGTTDQQPKQPTGEAITVNYARNIKPSARKPVKLSDPPPAKPKKKSATKPPTSPTTPTAVPADYVVSDESDNDNDDDRPMDSARFNLFPKVDPSPKHASRPSPFAKQQQAARIAEAQQTAPQKASMNLQNWLQTASVSPFGPLSKPETTAATAGAVAGAGVRGGRGVPVGLPAKVRLSEVKWPLQDNNSTGVARSESNGGMNVKPVTADGEAVIRDNEDAKTVPRPMVGLPGGPARKLPFRST